MRLNSIYKKSCSESLQNKSLKILNDSSDSREEEKEANNVHLSNRLLIWAIDINKCEEDAIECYQ